MTSSLSTVIIPCYNDGPTIGPIITTIKRSKLIGEIIVINDGSDDITTVILNKFTGIKLISLPKNKGKSNAMWTGIQYSKYDQVVFLDADYGGLRTTHLKKLIEPITNGQYDMVIGDLLGELAPFRAYGTSISLSGARAFNKSVLLKHPGIFKGRGYVNGFLVESLMNQIFFRQYRVAKVELKGLSNSYKLFKIGINGIFKDFKILSRITQAIGQEEFDYQLKFVRNLKCLN